MDKMQYLVLNDQPFQVQDPEAVRITAQTLTDEQKEQARQNIGAANAETLDSIIETADITENVPMSGWEVGGLTAGTGATTTQTSRVRTIDYIPLKQGDVVFSPASPALQFNVWEFDLNTHAYILDGGGWKKTYTVQNDCAVRIMAQTTAVDIAAGQISITKKNRILVQTDVLPTSEIQQIAEQVVDEAMGSGGQFVTGVKYAASQNELFHQISHRGYRATGAPQCTAPAYILAKRMGYDYGENDLRCTADGVFVMQHDDVMRGNTNITISGNTYETLQLYNMGTFNGLDVPILTFENWLILMKKIGLAPFIHVKITPTDEQIAEMVAIVKKHGMLDDVTWCMNEAYLAKIRQIHATARVAVISPSVHSGITALAIEGKPDLTLIYPQSTDVTAELVQAAYDAGIGIECWHVDYSSYGFDTEEAILAEIDRVVDLGVTGICVDTYLPGEHFINALNAEWGIE